ncbi:Alpha/Beta hydrolase protein [Chaetomium sp. MPI-SDFR-AT-0129]|nr:Alpha/Beta hydrolase protein [Chaetomium sp. MPI-SDFR-AT-0129]
MEFAITKTTTRSSGLRTLVPGSTEPSQHQSTIRSFFRGVLRRLNAFFGVIDARGPLGLNLLHEPIDPQADFIFVHGLFGGSRKTWSYSSEPGMFWPKEWLPKEANLQHVRVHSYGYGSNGSRKESFLTVHDFAQALIADIYNSPSLSENDSTPIVFVAHSMGGLVVKKAYSLALSDPIYTAVARRIRTIIFLGTPHQGADSAQIIRMIRPVAGYGAKAYLDDLSPGNVTLNKINDEFRDVCHNLSLWSFFEGVPTTVGPVSSLIVKKESAILGLPGEHIQYLEADHRRICKFESPMCPNYLILKRAFVTISKALEAEGLFKRRNSHAEPQKLVSSFLQVESRPDDICPAVAKISRRITCRWLTNDVVFQRWIQTSIDRSPDKLHAKAAFPESNNDRDRVLLLKGGPGSGKSVASSHVVKYLETRNLGCSYYYLNMNDETRSGIWGLLRSLAFQMAESIPDVQKAIVSLIEDGVTIDPGDYRKLWTELFVDRIFRLETLEHHFWVIDALDECSRREKLQLLVMLSDVFHSTPIRVFLSTRPDNLLESLFSQDNISFQALNTRQESFLGTMRLLFQAR